MFARIRKGFKLSHKLTNCSPAELVISPELEARVGGDIEAGDVLHHVTVTAPCHREEDADTVVSVFIDAV